MQAEPQQEHYWLQKLVGEWTFETEANMGPDQPCAKFQGTETVRTLGGVWVLCEGRGEIPGGGATTTIMTLGYDPAKKRFIGTFIGSMMTYLWIYDGALDAGGKVLTLDAEGPSFTAEGKMVKYQDIIEFKGEDHRELSSQTLGEDGKWHRFMTATYRRTRKA
ncbi:MAG TPA: DUF1579 domain-containing protein [Gemmataceae bacterium]|nr:DUF1579 domain-containing protein [Gemmataceae bacterium]